MIYVATIKTPHLTYQAAPVLTRVPITEGILYHAEFYFPPGPSGLVYAQLWDGSHQVFPSNEGEFFSGDNVNIAFDDMYPKENPPDELQVITWSDDDTYDQICVVRFSILQDYAFQARFAPNVSSDQLQAIIDLLEKQQNIPLSSDAQALLDKYSSTGLAT